MYAFLETCPSIICTHNNIPNVIHTFDLELLIQMYALLSNMPNHQMHTQLYSKFHLHHESKRIVHNVCISMEHAHPSYAHIIIFQMSLTHWIQNFSSRCMHAYGTCPSIVCTHNILCKSCTDGCQNPNLFPVGQSQRNLQISWQQQDMGI